MAQNLLEKYEQSQLERLTEGKEIPEFKSGDTIRVNVRIVEGRTERVQAFEGLCIARRNRGLNSAFTVRKISHGEGVERIFPLHSPRIESIKVIRRGVVRRAKLYYMRELTGKAARIAEKRDIQSANDSVAPKKKKSKKDAAPKASDVKAEPAKADDSKESPKS